MQVSLQISCRPLALEALLATVRAWEALDPAIDLEVFMQLTLQITCPPPALEALLTTVHDWHTLDPAIGVVVTVQTPDLITTAEAKALLARVGLGHFKVLTAI